MTISLAAEFGIDDTINDFGNPYDSSYGYDKAENNVLNNLNLSYGVEQDRANIGAQGDQDVRKIGAQGDQEVRKIGAAGDDTRKTMEFGDNLEAKKANRQQARARSLARAF